MIKNNYYTKMKEFLSDVGDSFDSYEIFENHELHGFYYSKNSSNAVYVRTYSKFSSENEVILTAKEIKPKNVKRLKNEKILSNKNVIKDIIPTLSSFHYDSEKLVKRLKKNM